MYILELYLASPPHTRAFPTQSLKAEVTLFKLLNYGSCAKINYQRLKADYANYSRIQILVFDNCRTSSKYFF